MRNILTTRSVLIIYGSRKYVVLLNLVFFYVCTIYTNMHINLMSLWTLQSVHSGSWVQICTRFRKEIRF